MRTWEEPIDPVKRRIDQYDIKARAIKPAAVHQLVMGNTEAEILGPVSLADGVGLSVRSYLENSANPKYRLGAVPYCIAFFEDALNTSSLIGFSVTGYNINGPMAMPNFDPLATTDTIGGSDGNNLVFLTEIINNTGMAHNIYVITNTRVWTPEGGKAV